ncbi:MAG: pyridoxal-5'-phosphate-dependent protein subunit beta [Chloroflexi bacterium]|nr:pyridoxal-5'-phosphate-dependent protein subunit beta [Chloroflexota bacterium]|tara:strand:- start:15032 stop:15994 length:963 start_codon:yes stop_codon:yes gene_type:complete
MLSYKPIALDEIINARERIKDIIVRTPLVKLNFDNQDLDIYIKLENLQPVGSFKLRGAANAMSLVSDNEINKGVWTVSAGNMAQGLAWCARERGIDCTVIVPEQIPETKAANITRLGAKYIKVPFAKFEETFITRSFPGVDGHFIHPFSDLSVMAGNGTIGLEILEDLPDVESLIISYAGGGLSCGIASAVKAINPGIKVYAAEVETGAPFAASLESGQPKIVNYIPSFVDGIGGSMVFNEMFDLAKELLDGSFISSLEEIAVASKIIMERNRIIVEGAAGAAVAAAMAGKAGKSKTACIISGGNIDSEKIKLILSGKIP